jgi:uncharacterized protein YgbK (DUF1537 family)
VGAEVAAARTVLGCDAAIITPAFPSMRRTVSAGFLRVEGAPFEPIHLPSNLRLEGCRHVTPLDVSEALRSGAPFVSVDAACDQDLDCIVAAGMCRGLQILWAGSAGLAAALARTLWDKLVPQPPRAPQPVLFCIGSDHPVTVEQQRRLQTERAAEVLWIPRSGVTAEQIGAGPGALLLSGGDTALAVCRALGAYRIDLIDEIEPGIPFGRLVGGMRDGCLVATKSGGFGTPDSLIKVADFFGGCDRKSQPARHAYRHHFDA